MKENLIKIPTKDLSEKDWQKLRQSFVDKGMTGGSDAGTLIGWNKYKSPVSMYYQALGIKQYENNGSIETLMGKMQEDNIAYQWQYYDEDDSVFMSNYFTQTKPRAYKKEKDIIINPDYPTLFANLDGIITKHPKMGSKKGILEIKKINSEVVRMYENELPPQYIAQCNHYMLVMGFDYAELCMRIDGRRMICHLIKANTEIQQAILIQSKEHGSRLELAKQALAAGNTTDLELMYQIAAQYEPMADATEDFKNFITEKHKERGNEKVIPGERVHDKWIDNYQKADAAIKEAEHRKLFWGNKLRQAMEKKGASVLDTDTNRITWRKSFLVKKKF